MGDLKIPSLFQIRCNWKLLYLPVCNCYLCMYVWVQFGKFKQYWQFGKKINAYQITLKRGRQAENGAIPPLQNQNITYTDLCRKSDTDTILGLLRPTFVEHYMSRGTTVTSVLGIIQETSLC